MCVYVCENLVMNVASYYIETMKLDFMLCDRKNWMKLV